MKPSRRLRPAEVADLLAPIFSKAHFSGSDLARRMGVKDNTLWITIFRQGPTSEMLRQMAVVITEWIDDLTHIKNRLLVLAERTERTRATDQTPPQPDPAVW